MRARLKRAAVWARRRLLEPEYPLLAVEVRPGSVGVVRLQREGGGLRLKAAALQELPAGTLVASLGEPNLVAPDALGAALRVALERAGALGQSRACLVLPDAAGRMTLLPTAELAGKPHREVDELVRFRLRKTLPFDVREAQVVMPALQRGGGSGFLPAAAAARRVIEQYEVALAHVGLQAGLVELAGWVCFASAMRLRPAGDRLVINWEHGYLTLVLARESEPVLVRSLTGQAVAHADDVVREIFNTVLYYRERLGGAGLAGATLRSGVLPAQEAIDLLREPLGLDAEILDPGASLPATTAAMPDGLSVALAAALERAA